MPQPGGQVGLAAPTELTYRYHAPHATTLTTLPRVTGHRWTVEKCFQ